MASRAARRSATPRPALLSRQSGKSTTVSLLALHVASFEPDSLVVLVAPAQRQSAELLRTIRSMHRASTACPSCAAIVCCASKWRMAGAFSRCPATAAVKTIRGLANCRLAIVDEAARVDDELFGAVRPMLAVNRDGAMILLSTPAGRRGAFYELWHNNDPTWHRVRVPASDCPRISKEFLAEELRELGQALFQRRIRAGIHRLRYQRI